MRTAPIEEASRLLLVLLLGSVAVAGAAAQDPVALEELIETVARVNGTAFPVGGADSPGSRALALRRSCSATTPAELRAHESCSDLVNSVCREVLQAQGGFEYRGPEAFRGWLFAWARHKLQDRARYWHAGKRTALREHAVAEDESLGQLGPIGPAAGCGAPTRGTSGSTPCRRRPRQRRRSGL